MKKTILWSALFTLICTQVTAEVTQQPIQSQTQSLANTTPATNVQTNQAPVVKQGNPIIEPTQVQPTQTLPANQQPAQNVQQTQPNTVQPVQIKPAPVVNCDYTIPAQIKTIEQSLIINWSEKAVTQAFDFDPAQVDNQVQKLKTCFTEQGWSGFNLALEKSGNLEAIKTQQLTVSSQLDGQTQVTATKDNQWKVTLPLHVVYQNDKEKVTQLLSVNLTVGRKTSGDLGIVQMIATPRTATAPVDTTTNPASNTTVPVGEPATKNANTSNNSNTTH